ncbi:hypothetical protein [Catalinimonas niigatensis]|uniref:hypothetical protein n=1 Tax=Catalinimonas niigatensis TaxID=1397264 RepID=UPI002667002C|nr:hypothetical protein [Catalinimonas niigatensis]WPP47965.1 hypothetical protein PZB72_14905 [Catalinimonas niigatensis]
MACRERKHGVGGTLEKKRNFTSNADLLEQLMVIESKSECSMEYFFDKLLDRQHDTELKLRTEIAKLNATVISMSKQMDVLMLVAAIAPVVSPAVATWFKEVAMGQKPPVDGIKEDLEAIGDRLDKQTKLQLKKLLEEKKLQEVASLLSV